MGIQLARCDSSDGPPVNSFGGSSAVQRDWSQWSAGRIARNTEPAWRPGSV